MGKYNQYINYSSPPDFWCSLYLLLTTVEHEYMFLYRTAGRINSIELHTPYIVRICNSNTKCVLITDIYVRAFSARIKCQYCTFLSLAVLAGVVVSGVAVVEMSSSLIFTSTASRRSKKSFF